MMGWQWYQLNHMQIICTSLQTDNHASTPPLSFYRLDALRATQPTVSKHCLERGANDLHMLDTVRRHKCVVRACVITA